MKKINLILADSLIYKKLKQLFLFLCGAFEGTFLYKLLFTEIDDKLLGESLFSKLFKLVKKIGSAFYELISDVFLVKIGKKIINCNIKPVLSTSVILRVFGISGYQYSLLFLICLGALLSVSFIPTMPVAALCLLLFVLMFTDKSFGERMREIKPVASDIFILLYMLAVFHARNISNDPQRNQIYIIYTVFIGSYFILRYYLANAEKIKLALSALASGGIVVCAVGFLQFATGSYKTSKWTDQNMFSDIQGRLVSTFENPNVLGEYLLFIIPIAIAMLLITDKLIWRLIYGGVALGALFCMVLTYSRGCWIGLILGMGIFIVMLYPKLLLPIGLAAPFSVFFIPDSIITRLTSIGNLSDSSSSYRVYLWRGTTEMLKDIWKSGIGLGTDAYIDAYSRYAYEGVIAPHCHNTYLHVMCESGIFGVAVFVVLLYFSLRQLFITYKEAECRGVKIMAVALVSGIVALMLQAMFDNTFYNYRMYMLFFAILAISSALYAVRKEKLK